MQDLTPSAIGSSDMPDQESAIQPAQSPLWPQHLIDLFIRPGQFFAGQLALGKTPYVLFVTWCFGIATAIDRIDQEILRAEMGAARAGWESIAPMLVGSWAGYWAMILAYGAISAVMIWYLGGWWYAKRLSWSGATEPDRRLARLVYVYASFVSAGPTVAYTLAVTMVYENYQAAFLSDELYSMLLLVFPFWSVVCSYIGVRTLFEVKKGPALVWFAILPSLLYVMAFGLIAAIVGLMSSG